MRPWQKLNSRRGASILFAILIFMMCILAGTAALTAASANSGRYAHMKADQQRYLSVASAAQLLTEEFTQNRFTANLNVTETRDKQMVTSREVEKGGTATDEGIKLEGDLGKLEKLKQHLSLVCWADAGVKDPTPGTNETYKRPADPFRTKLTLKAEGMDDVTAVLEVNGYDVTIVLYAGTEDSYRTQIRLTAMKTENVTNMNKKFTEDKVITTWVSEVTVRWPEENVIVTAQSGGASAGGGSGG